MVWCWGWRIEGRRIRTYVGSEQQKKVILPHLKANIQVYPNNKGANEGAGRESSRRFHKCVNFSVYSPYEYANTHT